ncbi:glutamate--tRNA ligase [Marinomonas posidonica]|uniref:Glutamate--tRNA ligase n=1 Tax=Marinomonas posidonica (strain CECT 7376 / NCIMB 14433 / IVIA-Po-181) TaxID=491952 RepID=F6CVC8_MARPP|nr:glutamate--tRNA ligase [Marinomonas posidonica]AEF54238.1 glutamyl-tRNA synthetase [Marinomonas posidonica IVIA-Po-181]
MSEVRTRIAPSPTGDPHVGTAYIALFNMAFARKMGGKFILRIEDTDQTRSTPESEKMILDALRWLGLDWAEGPDVGGEYGPYRQSERGDIYGQYARELVEKGHAFYAFETPEELDQMRAEQKEQGLPQKYDGRALLLSQAEVQAKLDAGVPYVIRMKVPEEGVCVVQDMLRGTIEIDWAQVDMQVLLKADGMPTYHLANVVDDHLMKITHVIRGEEWINSAPKHILLYQYFGWDMPTLCHMPLLRNPDKSKLSKRKNPTSILYYQRMGYMSEAVINYLGRMGWSMPDEREKFSLDEMIEQFDIQRVSLGGPVFDVEKLSWLNGMWIRENLTAETFAQKYVEWALNPEYLMKILPLVIPRVETFSDVADVAGFFLKGLLPLTKEDFASIKMEEETLRKAMQFALWRLEALNQWEKDNIFNELKSLAQSLEIKPKDLFAPLFVAISGSTASVSVFDAMAILGSDISRARMRTAVNALGGPSKKEAKRWEKEYAAL